MEELNYRKEFSSKSEPFGRISAYILPSFMNCHLVCVKKQPQVEKKFKTELDAGSILQRLL